jgi:hypothetical protein
VREASGFSGFVVWHMGYSGSGPLTAATPGSFIEKQVGHVIPGGHFHLGGGNALVGLGERVCGHRVTRGHGPRRHIHFTGGTVTLNIVNWMFLALIFLLSRNAFEVMALVKNAASNVATCPPPEGTKKFTRPAERKARKPRVWGEATSTMESEVPGADLPALPQRVRGHGARQERRLQRG